MANSFIIRPSAKKDIVEIALYISGDNAEAAERFIDAVKRSFELLADMPDVGVVRRFRNAKLGSVRMWPIKHFTKFLIFYRHREGCVEVLRVLHAARDIKSLMEHE